MLTILKSVTLGVRQNKIIMGIINFRGKRDKAISKLAEQILVSDYMTKKLITFKPSDSLGHVINLLIKNEITFIFFYLFSNPAFILTNRC